MRGLVEAEGFFGEELRCCGECLGEMSRRDCAISANGLAAAARPVDWMTLVWRGLSLALLPDRDSRGD